MHLRSNYPLQTQSRNFALNPEEGLKIHAFKHAHTEQAQADRELEKLSRYMVHIALMGDFRTVNHKVSPTCRNSDRSLT